MCRPTQINRFRNSSASLFVAKYEIVIIAIHLTIYFNYPTFLDIFTLLAGGWEKVHSCCVAAASSPEEQASYKDGELINSQYITTSQLSVFLRCISWTAAVSQSQFRWWFPKNEWWSNSHHHPALILGERRQRNTLNLQFGLLNCCDVQIMVTL